MKTSSEGTINFLKNFIYLDEAKLNSFVSQVFSGTTEYILSSSGDSEITEEQQKGGVVSGKILKAIFNENKNTLEKKFLYDYSYKIFEEHLYNINAITDVNGKIDIGTINNCRFIKIIGKIKFIDISVILDTLESFPDISEAFALICQWDAIKQIDLQDNKRGKKTRDAIRGEIKKEAHKESEFYKKLKLVLQFGYKDMFAVQTVFENMLFTAEIKRQYLREEEQFLIRKYSRASEKDFIILGNIACKPSAKPATEEGSLENAEHIRRSLFQLIDQFSNVEQTMLGSLDNEIIIDPIAIYCEV